MKHVYDWLDEPPKDEGERLAKEWLEKFCQPVVRKNRKGTKDYLDSRKVWCEFKGERIHCSGASRMGDVWLKRKGSKSFYDLRVSVEDLSNWEVEIL